MRFSLTLVTVALSVASVLAQSSSSFTVPSTTSSAASASTTNNVMAMEQQCVKQCGAGQVACIAQCVGVPAPSTEQVNQTNVCVAACPKGNGSAEANLAYGECQDNCIET